MILSQPDMHLKENPMYLSNFKQKVLQLLFKSWEGKSTYLNGVESIAESWSLSGDAYIIKNKSFISLWRIQVSLSQPNN